MEKWGLGWAELSAINPGIVMVRVSGFGQDGPYAGRAGYGGIGEAMGGLRQVCGDPDTPPSRVGISIGDSLAAMFACIGCLAALRHRDATGRGQVVDSAIYESVLGVMESTVPEFTEGGHVRERTGSILPGLAPSNVYPTSDGRMVLIGANQDTVFRRLCDAMGRPELSADSRFAAHRARGDHQQVLDEIIAGWSVTLAEDDLLELLETHGVPAGRIFRAPDMLSDPQYVARRSVLRVPHPEFENLWMQNVFPRLSETAGAIRWPGPAMGAHNEEIYGGLLGMDVAERRELSAAGVI
jgi:crotonobetainyl-CoA:carnitine CoA-transferase CaiB-like acyl-CoA transferase